MYLLGATHLAFASASIVSGATVLYLQPKGGRWHKRLGWAYVVSMLAMNVTALMIYRLFGGFGPFHVGAIVSLISLALGTMAAIGARRARRRRDPAARELMIRRHYRGITFSYIGLMAAFASEAAVRIPVVRETLGRGFAFAMLVLFASLFVVAVGVRLVRTKAAGLLAPFIMKAPAR